MTMRDIFQRELAGGVISASVIRKGAWLGAAVWVMPALIATWPVPAATSGSGRYRKIWSDFSSVYEYSSSSPRSRPTPLFL